MIPNKFVVFINDRPVSFRPMLIGKPNWRKEIDPGEITYFDSKEDAERLINLYPITFPFAVKEIQFRIMDE